MSISSVCMYIRHDTFICGWYVYTYRERLMICVTYHVKHTIESYHTHQHVDAFIHLPHSHQQDWLVGINHSVIYDWETYSLMHVSIWMRHMGSDPLDMSICSRYENIDAFVCESIWMRHTLMRVSMTESTDNAASPKSTRSSNSHFAVSPGTKTNSHEPGIDLNVYRGIHHGIDLGLIWMCTEEFKFVDLVDFRGVSLTFNGIYNMTVSAENATSSNPPNLQSRNSRYLVVQIQSESLV